MQFFSIYRQVSINSIQRCILLFPQPYKNSVSLQIPTRIIRKTGFQMSSQFSRPAILDQSKARTMRKHAWSACFSCVDRSHAGRLYLVHWAWAGIQYTWAEPTQVHTCNVFIIEQIWAGSFHSLASLIVIFLIFLWIWDYGQSTDCSRTSWLYAQKNKKRSKKNQQLQSNTKICTVR